MKRIIYVAGVNRKHLAEQAKSCPYWLLSASLLRKYPAWLESYMPNRNVIWDPGTFTEDCISYQAYRQFIDRNVKSRHKYMQYDEIGDHEATDWYLRNMRKRGYRPIPVLQPGGKVEMLKQEPLVCVGGLVKMNADDRARYLDQILTDDVAAKVHLLGMIKHEWFRPYSTAVQGDNTSWIPRSEWNRRKTVTEWMMEYGEQWIPYQPNAVQQLALNF